MFVLEKSEKRRNIKLIVKACSLPTRLSYRSIRRGVYIELNIREHSVSEVGSRPFVRAHASGVVYKRTDTNLPREL
jgi:hypothetical protein